MTTTTKITMAELGDLRAEEILALRFCDFAWSLNDLPAPLMAQIRRVVRECAAKNLALAPRFFVAKEWLCPEGSTAIGIPFYLMHPKLLAMELTFKHEAEGAEPAEFLRLLRHELGHAFDHAYNISSKRDFKGVFGSPQLPYAPEFYLPDHSSKAYVEHLPGHYAQAHPLEDFAETFAVWLDPLSQWPRRYARRPGALAKLRFVENQAQIWAGALPLQQAPLLGEASKSVLPLSLHYKRQLTLMAKIRSHVTMER